MSKARFILSIRIDYLSMADLTPSFLLKKLQRKFFIWDRALLKKAQERKLIDPDHKFGNYDEVYIGHTPTINFGKKEPQKFCNVWAMDTGAGWGAKLTIMDIDTKQYWQSS